MIWARYGSSLVLAAVVTFGLFFLMQILIATGQKAMQDGGKTYRVEIGEVRRDTEVETRDRKPDKPEEPEAPPEAPDTPDMDQSEPDPNAINMSDGVGVELDISGGVGVGARSDGDYLPIVRVQPQYPRRAAERGIEGWVIVQLTVLPSGGTTDVEVIDSSSSIFNQAAIRAAERFRYQPRMVNGEPVAVSGVQYQFTFELED